jgi:hypothetical protein
MVKSIARQTSQSSDSSEDPAIWMIVRNEFKVMNPTALLKDYD